MITSILNNVVKYYESLVCIYNLKEVLLTNNKTYNENPNVALDTFFRMCPICENSGNEGP